MATAGFHLLHFGGGWMGGTLCVRLSVCVRLSIRLSVCLSVLCVCLSVCLSGCLCVCVCVLCDCMSMSAFLFGSACRHGCMYECTSVHAFKHLCMHACVYVLAKTLRRSGRGHKMLGTPIQTDCTSIKQHYPRKLHNIYVAGIYNTLCLSFLA